MKKNEIIELIIDRVDFPNKGQGVYEGEVVRFKGGIAGQKVKTRVHRRKKEYVELKILEVLEKSSIQTEPTCPHFGSCGGCSYQGLSYENELLYKENQIKELFKENELDVNFLGIEPSPVVVGYRNKMEYTFGDEFKDGPLALGLHRKGRFYEVVNVEGCNIVDNDFITILVGTLNYFQEANASFYNKRNHEGFLRHLVVRKASSTGGILINLVTSSQSILDAEGFISMINDLGYKGTIKGILHTTNDGLSDMVQADRMDLLYGENFITEELLGLKFNISPFSFFQTNTLGAERLYTIVREFAGDIDDKVVFDLYSGTGTIAQIMAPVAKKVIGIEIVEEAVIMAKENAKVNRLDNVEFIAGDVLKAVDELSERPNLIVIDPPRDGIHPKAINKIIDFNPESFVYVSCNPVTLVRDLKVFMYRGYRVDKVKLMDQFPRTPHVEVVTLLVKV